MTTNLEHRILLTGGSGALGYHILRQLRALPGVKVLALLRGSSELLPDHREVAVERVDFADQAALRRILAAFSPTCVIHSAASGLQRPRPNWFDLAAFNIETTLRLFQCSAAVPGCHFVFIGTGLAYRSLGRPLREDDPIDTLHPYGATKGAADVLVRSAAAELEVPLTVIRPFSFTGIGDPAGRLFPSLLRAAAEKVPFEMSPGCQLRDHCATGDIAAGIVSAAKNPPSGALQQRVINLGSGSSESLRSLVSSVVDRLALDVHINFGAKPYALHEPMHLVADIAQAKELLGWHPQISLAYSVWELAETTHPRLELKKPERSTL
jgi:nucleoside-diphosphate-sugar epimerase